MRFNGRDQHLTETLEGALKKADKKGSEKASIYGKLYSVVDDKEAQVQYRSYSFSPDISEKLLNGTLIIPSTLSVIIEDKIAASLKAKEKRRLKTITKVYRKR